MYETQQAAYPKKQNSGCRIEFDLVESIHRIRDDEKWHDSQKKEAGHFCRVFTKIFDRQCIRSSPAIISRFYRLPTYLPDAPSLLSV
jgi:hypothetical protein